MSAKIAKNGTHRPPWARLLKKKSHSGPLHPKISPPGIPRPPKWIPMASQDLQNEPKICSKIDRNFGYFFFNFVICCLIDCRRVVRTLASGFWLLAWPRRGARSGNKGHAEKAAVSPKRWVGREGGAPLREGTEAWAGWPTLSVSIQYRRLLLDSAPQ
mgnify:CR=1 FL=1